MTMPTKNDDPQFKGLRQRITVEDNGKYYHIMLNMADDDLDPYEYRLLGHYVRVGKCWENTRTTAKKTQMSAGKVSMTRDTLHSKGYINVEYRGKDTCLVTVIDRMAENVARYQNQRSPHEHVHDMNTDVHHMNANVHQVKQRITNEEKPKKKNTLGVWSAAELAMSEMFASLTSAMVKPHEEQSAKLVEQNRKEAATLLTNGVTPETLKAFYRDTYTNGYVPSSLAEIRKKIGAWQAKHTPKAPPATNGNLQNTVRLYGLVGDVE